MEWPWLARMSQSFGSREVEEVVVVSRGFRAKRCLSEFWTRVKISGTVTVGDKERMGGHESCVLLKW